MINQLANMIALVATKFQNRSDKAGRPYILHCLRVMNSVHGDDEIKCIAVGHDLIEDTDVTEEMLRELGFSERVIFGIKILTHDPSVPYDDYIKIISNYPDCIEVKKSDLEDNSNITRLKGLRKKDFERMEKYHRAYMYLSN